MTSIAFGRPAALPFLRLPFVVAFAAAALAAGLGRAVTTTYLPLLLERINDAPGLIGMVMLVNAGAGMAVPLVVGLWSDRLGRSGHGRRLPFILGGAVVTAGGLLAIALGSSSSYLVLALSAAVVYTGLNAVTTAHRALIPETFDASGRPKATSAQELAMLVGGLLGLAVGGALTGLALWAPFALSAILVPLLALPTIRRVTEPEEHEPAAASSASRPTGYYLRAAARPGVRGFLLAQILWVLGYAALPAFFLLYAEEELGLAAGAASLWLAGFGLATGMGIVLAGRVKNPALHRPLLLAGDRPARRRLPRRRPLDEPRARRRGARPRRGRLRPRLDAGLPALLGHDPRARGRRLHRPLLLRSLDLLDDRTAGRRLDGAGDGELPLTLSPGRHRDHDRTHPTRRPPAGEEPAPPRPRPARGRARARAARRPDLGAPLRRVALQRDQRARPGPRAALDDPRPAHAQLPRADRRSASPPPPSRASGASPRRSRACSARRSSPGACSRPSTPCTTGRGPRRSSPTRA